MNANEPIRNARSLGVSKLLILGIQHLFAMFGATILVPILVQQYGLPLNIQTTLFFAGVGTLFFHVCAKFRVPAFLGSSFAFLGGFSTMANLDSGAYATMAAKDKLAYACGGIVVAGLLYLILAAVIKMVGVKKVMRFLPPVVTGPIIICIGLTLAPSAVNNASNNWILALIALSTIIVFNIWGKGMFKIIPILMGVVISYAAALIMNAMGMTNADGSAILNFTGCWNNTTGVMLTLRNEELYTIPMALLLNFTQQISVQYEIVFAGVIMTSIPLIVAYCYCQKFFVTALAGSVKG